MIAASADDQSALEGYKGHGVFTWVLMDGLTGKTDINKDGYTNVTELSLYIESMVPEFNTEIGGMNKFHRKTCRKRITPW